MKKLIRAATLILAFAFALCLSPVAAFGAEINLSREVTISITPHSVDNNGAVVKNTAFVLYKTGDIHITDNGAEYTLTADFADSGADLESDLESSSLAAALAEWADENGISGTNKSSDSNGTVYFGNLAAGLYLVVQTKTPSGYISAAPFLIAAPESDGAGGYIYDIDASPKVQLELETTTTTETTTPAENVTLPPTSGDDTSSRLLKTGQLNWPVPVLAAAGVLFFVAGMIMVFFERKKGRRES